MNHAKIDQRLSVFGVNDFEIFHGVTPIGVPQIRGGNRQGVLCGASHAPDVPQCVDGKRMAQTVGPGMSERHVSDDLFGTPDADPFDG